VLGANVDDDAARVAEVVPVHGRVTRGTAQIPDWIRERILSRRQWQVHALINAPAFEQRLQHRVVDELAAAPGTLAQLLGAGSERLEGHAAIRAT
jgi:hypothetical protein